MSDRFAVRNTFIDEFVVGHQPAVLREFLSKFLSGSQIFCEVRGKTVNCGSRCGLEIPIELKLSGHKEAVNWARDKINKIFGEQRELLKPCVHWMFKTLDLISKRYYCGLGLGNLLKESAHFLALIFMNWISLTEIQNFSQPK